jgi:hypothetical protein
MTFKFFKSFKNGMEEYDALLDYLLDDIDIETESEEKRQEFMLLSGFLPENVLIENVFSNGQNALHLIMRSNKSSQHIEHIIDYLLKIGVDSFARDNNGLFCTDYEVAGIHFNMIRKIYKWQLTRYPTIWDYEFVNKNYKKISLLDYIDYYQEIINSENKRISKAFKEYYRDKSKEDI